MKYSIFITALFLFFSQNQAIGYQSKTEVETESTDEYVQLTKLSDRAEIIANIVVRKAIKLPAERSPGLSSTMGRLYIEADVLNLISGRGGLPESIRYLVDVPLDDRGKFPKLKKQRFIIFANRSTGRINEVQLTGPNAQLAWTSMRESQIRTIVRELFAADAPPEIEGIREVFHVSGNLEGEGETQLFLDTATDAPISISIIRRPGIRPSWAVSLTEIVDSAAMRPAKNTLLWYRLACGLPPTLPNDALYSGNANADNVARADYALVIRELGPCR